MDIETVENYNIIKGSNIVSPNYDISDKTLYIDIYMNYDNNVIIIGEIDYNYAAWTSFTTASEYELNRLIIKHNIEMSNDSAVMPVATYYSGYMNSIGLTEGKSSLLNYYKVTISRQDTEVKENIGINSIWKSTEGKSYAGRVNDIAGEIASDIETLSDDIRKKQGAVDNREVLCSLRNYKKDVDKCEKNFSIELYDKLKIWSVQDEIEKQPYYILSENDEIRNLYCELRAKCHNLYRLYRSLTY